MKIVLVTLLMTQAAFADENRGAERFEKQIKKVRELVNRYDGSTKLTDAFLRYDMRAVFFKAQALTRVYRNADPIFVQMNKDFKKFEDRIGAYEKWDSIYRKAPTSKKPLFLAKRNRAWDRIRSTIRKGKWQRRYLQENPLVQYTQFLGQYQFGTYNEDRQYVTKTLSDHLTVLNSKVWDLRFLEHGNGLHEFRREIRWILHEIRNLRGLVQYKKKPRKTCPIPGFDNLLDSSASNSRYAKFPIDDEEINPCLVSKCVVLSMSKAVDDLGEIKDKIEVKLNAEGRADEDLVPAKYIDDIQDIHDILKKNQVFAVLERELKACSLE